MRWFAASVGCVFAAVSFGSAARAVTFDDGLVHVIDAGNSFPFEGVTVDDGPGGAPTMLNIVPGGYVGFYVKASGNSQVNMSGGEVGTALQIFNDSQLEFSGGIAKSIDAYHQSTAVFTGGTVTNTLNNSGPDTTVTIFFVTTNYLSVSGGRTDVFDVDAQVLFVQGHLPHRQE